MMKKGWKWWNVILLALMLLAMPWAFAQAAQDTPLNEVCSDFTIELLDVPVWGGTAQIRLHPVRANEDVRADFTGHAFALAVITGGEAIETVPEVEQNTDADDTLLCTLQFPASDAAQTLSYAMSLESGSSFWKLFLSIYPQSAIPGENEGNVVQLDWNEGAQYHEDWIYYEEWYVAAGGERHFSTLYPSVATLQIEGEGEAWINRPGLVEADASMKNFTFTPPEAGTRFRIAAKDAAGNMQYSRTCVAFSPLTAGEIMIPERIEMQSGRFYTWQELGIVIPEAKRFQMSLTIEGENTSCEEEGGLIAAIGAGEASLNIYNEYTHEDLVKDAPVRVTGDMGTLDLKFDYDGVYYLLSGASRTVRATVYSNDNQNVFDVPESFTPQVSCAEGLKATIARTGAGKLEIAYTAEAGLEAAEVIPAVITLKDAKDKTVLCEREYIFVIPEDDAPPYKDFGIWYVEDGEEKPAKALYIGDTVTLRLYALDDQGRKMTNIRLADYFEQDNPSGWYMDEMYFPFESQSEIISLENGAFEVSGRIVTDSDNFAEGADASHMVHMDLHYAKDLPGEYGNDRDITIEKSFFLLSPGKTLNTQYTMRQGTYATTEMIFGVSDDSAFGDSLGILSIDEADEGKGLVQKGSKLLYAQRATQSPVTVNVVGMYGALQPFSVEVTVVPDEEAGTYEIGGWPTLFRSGQSTQAELILYKTDASGTRSEVHMDSNYTLVIYPGYSLFDYDRPCTFSLMENGHMSMTAYGDEKDYNDSGFYEAKLYHQTGDDGRELLYTAEIEACRIAADQAPWLQDFRLEAQDAPSLFRLGRPYTIRMVPTLAAGEAAGTLKDYTLKLSIWGYGDMALGVPQEVTVDGVMGYEFTVTYGEPSDGDCFGVRAELKYKGSLLRAVNAGYAAGKKGDVNGDGIVSVADAKLVLEEIIRPGALNKAQRARARMDEGEEITTRDAILILINLDQ